MLKKRIIVCLDIMDGRVVKGINFSGLKDAGDPVELARKYTGEGVDELVFLDISATYEKRKTLLYLVEKIAEQVDIPFTVGGGIRSPEDAGRLIAAGADKVSINSAAVLNPALIQQVSQRFGNQALVVAVDIKPVLDEWFVFINGGRVNTRIKITDWVRTAEDFGAGEFLLTAMSHDGVKGGFALDIIRQIAAQVHVPVIASGGAGTYEHFRELFEGTEACAALAASVFHFNTLQVPLLKSYLQSFKIPVRC